MAGALDPKPGLSALLAQSGADEETVEAAERIESVPGGAEVLYTTAASEMLKGAGVPKKDAKKVRLYCMGGSVNARRGGYASANPYPRGSDKHRQWNRKYVEPGGNGDIPGLARGGAAHGAAEQTRQAGRGEDEMLVHMTPEEFGIIRQMWGEPDINPNTGMPEYGFFSKAWKKVKKAVKKVVKSPIFQTVAPIALSVFAPGIGTAIGAGLGLSGTAASVAGNALVRGGLGALTGGKEGAIRGAISGGVSGGLGRVVGQRVAGMAGKQLSDKTADVLGSALVQGTGSRLAGGDFASGAVAGGLESFMELRPEQVGEKIRTAYTGLAPGQAGPPLPRGKGIFEAAKAAAIPVGLAAMSAGAGKPYEPEAPPWATGDGDEFGSSFGESLPVFTMNRRFVSPVSDPASYYTYGQPGAPMQAQQIFLDTTEPFPGQGVPGAPPTSPPPDGLPGALETVLGRRFERQEGASRFAARGTYVRGPGSGRSDDIDARLSDGEYVIDAESVALLGDGSGAEGARRLDQMRQNLRKHKGENLKKGKFSHKAKDPTQYMGQRKARGGKTKMNRLRRAAKYGYGGVHNVGQMSPASPVHGANPRQVAAGGRV